MSREPPLFPPVLCTRSLQPNSSEQRETSPNFRFSASKLLLLFSVTFQIYFYPRSDYILYKQWFYTAEIAQ